MKRTVGAAFSAAGKYIPATGYTVENNPPPVPFYTIPTGGGLIREPITTGQSNKDGTWTWTTSPNVLYVRSELKYNALATIQVKKTNGTNPHLLGTAWAKDK